MSDGSGSGGSTSGVIYYNDTASARVTSPSWSAERRRPRVLLGVTGSVAAVKWEELCLGLLAFADVRVVHTRSALHFAGLCRAYAPTVTAAWAVAAAEASPGSLGVAGSDVSLPVASARLGLLVDAVEWEGYACVGADTVAHIELKAWADALVIAPASAHTVAKLAGGLADNLLSTAARAWPFVRGRVAKPFIVAPAMNTDMWTHPVTATQLAIITGWGVSIVDPVEKVLACGDLGVGGLAPITDIIQRVKEELGFGLGLGVE